MYSARRCSIDSTIQELFTCRRCTPLLLSVVIMWTTNQGHFAAADCMCALRL